MSLQKCANFSGPICACATDTRIKPEYPVLFSMFSGEFCLRLKPYLVVKIAPDVLTEHCCQVCVLVMMFCRPDCRLCAGMCGKSGTSVPRVLTNSRRVNFTQTPLFGTVESELYGAVWCFDLLTLRQANMGIWKIFVTFDFHILP